MRVQTVCSDQVIDALREVVGDRLATSKAVRAHHGKDVSYHAPHDPDAVVYAHSTDEVSAVVRVCARHRVPVVPYGTGLSVSDADTLLAEI